MGGGVGSRNSADISSCSSNNSTSTNTNANLIPSE